MRWFVGHVESRRFLHQDTDTDSIVMYPLCLSKGCLGTMTPDIGHLIRCKSFCRRNTDDEGI